MSRTTRTLTTTTETVKPTRLTRDTRRFLKSLAQRIVSEGRAAALKAVEADTEKANTHVAKQIAAILKVIFPQRDMAVLAQYSSACKLSERSSFDIRVDDEGTELSLDEDPWRNHPLLADILVPWRDPEDIEYPAHFQIVGMGSYTLGGPGLKLDMSAFDEINKKRGAIYDEFNKRENAYFTLIDQSRTLEQVIDVWPEVAALAAHLRGDVPASILPAEAVEIVKRDVAERAKLKALPAPRRAA